MEDAELFDRLASVYGLGPLQSAQRCPPRQAGPPSIVLRSSAGREIFVKPHGEDSHAIYPYFQRSVALQTIAARSSGGVVRAVLAKDGGHGSVLDAAVGRDEFLTFTASEFVHGESALTAPVSRQQAESILCQLGAISGHIQNASNGIGPWDEFPFAEKHWLRQLAEQAGVQGKPWASQLQRLVSPISKAIKTLPVSDRGRDYFGFPVDFQPKDFLIDHAGQLFFSDFEIVNVTRSDDPLVFRYSIDSWPVWAEQRGVPAERANDLINHSFVVTRKRPPATRRNDDLLGAYRRLRLDLHDALYTGPMLKEVREDSNASVPERIAALAECLSLAITARDTSAPISPSIER